MFVVRFLGKFVIDNIHCTNFRQRPNYELFRQSHWRVFKKLKLSRLRNGYSVFHPDKNQTISSAQQSSSRNSTLGSVDPAFDKNPQPTTRPAQRKLHIFNK